jgi:hypothetical protein
MLIIFVAVLAGGAVVFYQQLQKTSPVPPVACTMEAKLCLDGSAVGRGGSKCEFSPCPTADSWPAYFSGKPGYTIRHPSSFTVNSGYLYTELGPGKEISGVSFTIPSSLAIGTNLRSDTYISVETGPRSTSCTPSLFLDNVQSTSTVTDNDITYQVGFGSGAGAGNFYEETVYILPSYSCTAVRYFIHSMNIGNYPSGAASEFDRPALLDLFNQMRRSYQES